jgi:LuxR family quorum sensing-dependent transcriptional regulator
MSLLPSERRVLQAVADHGTTPRAAAWLGRSPHTVKFHLKNVRLEFGARNTTEAVAIGIRKGLIR